ncbi:hypothetical protein D3C74_427270 [compost metagenome]
MNLRLVCYSFQDLHNLKWKFFRFKWNASDINLYFFVTSSEMNDVLYPPTTQGLHDSEL